MFGLLAKGVKRSNADWPIRGGKERLRLKLKLGGREYREKTFCDYFEFIPATAKELGVETRWLNNLKKKGLKYESKKSLPHLEALAEFYGWESYLDLWSEDLIESMGLPRPKVSELQQWMKSPNWNHATKFLRLLDSGKFNHLKRLIEDLEVLEENKIDLTCFQQWYAENQTQEPKPAKKGTMNEKINSLKSKKSK